MIWITEPKTYGWEAAVRGMRNPMNSWINSDSTIGFYKDEFICDLGPKDIQLMSKLFKAGTDHRKFLRMITVTCDITAPLYWWKEFDTYKVGTVSNSCSTMHKIHSKTFTEDDFSWDKLNTLDPIIEKDFEGEYFSTKDVSQLVLNMLNELRELYILTRDKSYWYQMIQLLPSSYNQHRTILMNYEVLANIYKSRKDHKLDEWKTFCEWIEELPYFEDLLAPL